MERVVCRVPVPPADDDDPRISYTIRQLIAELKAEMTANFGRLFAALDGKASRADLDLLAARYETLHDQVRDLRTERDQDRKTAERASGWRRWGVEIALTAALVAVTLLLAFKK